MRGSRARSKSTLRQWRATLLSPRGRLDIFAGFVDGILNALILAVGCILKSGDGADLGLLVLVALLRRGLRRFFFIGHYAAMRVELVRAEQELNLLSHGRLRLRGLAVDPRIGRIQRFSCSHGSSARWCRSLCGRTFAAQMPRPNFHLRGLGRL